VTHLLVVDDSAENSYVLETLLRANHYTVDVAANGREALEKARVSAPELVISDILMPVMDGFTLCRQWMLDPDLCTIPFIFYSSAYTDTQDVAFGLSLGALRFITKPTEPEEFLRVILDVLDEYEHGGLPVSPPILEDEPVYLKVYNERLVRRLEDKMMETDAAARRLRALLEATTGLSLLRPERELIEHALLTLASAMDYSQAHYFAFDPDEQNVRYLLAVGQGHESAGTTQDSTFFHLGEMDKLAVLVAQTGAPLIIPDTTQDPRWVMTDPSIRSALLVPVTHDDKLYGVCTFVSTDLGAFSVEDRSNAAVLAATLAIAIENVRLYQSQVEITDNLEELVAQRTHELGIALEKAQAADRLKGQFISDINHELRTPLTSISLYLDLLLHVNDQKRRDIVDVMKRETALLQEMIENLLDFSRLDLGKAEVKMELIHLDQFVDILVADRGHLAAEKGLIFAALPTAPVRPVSGNQQLIYQALTNLVINAIKYTESGSVTLRCGEVETNGAGWSTVSVSDTGPGIPFEEQEHLFDRFYRGVSAQKKGIPGTGLGLAICQEIIARHNGRITVESAPGQGSTFTIWLPHIQSTQ